MGQPLPYITPAGYQRMRAELDELWLRRRPEVTRAVAEAAAMGDRSENAEYIYGKKMLREIDRRIRYLRKRLELLQVVSELPDDRSRVFFGARITIEWDSGEECSYRIVGHDEFDHKDDYISIDAPLARALLGRTTDDEVVLMLNGSERSLLVLSVDYPD
jgi:transcription elongation factor GreB